MHVPPWITVRPLSYEDRLDARDAAAIDLVVIHCTELPDLAMAREYGERIHHPDSRTGNCGHYYVDRDGTVEQWISPLREAHHVRGFNPRSVGIELVNAGRYPDWLDSRKQAMSEPYPDPQLAALAALLGHLRDTLPALRWIAGHEDLDVEEVPASDDPALRVRRKRDPGVMFPWPRILECTPLERRFVA